MSRKPTQKTPSRLPEWLQTLRKRAKKRHPKMKSTLLYYVTSPAVVVAPAEDALLIDCIFRALKESKTWGDFHRAVPEEYERIMQTFDEADESRPADNDAFDKNKIGGADEGDYPRWLRQEMLEWLPEAAIIECLDIGQSAVSGPCPEVRPDNAERLIELLRQAGYKLEHRPDLKFE